MQYSAFHARIGIFLAATGLVCISSSPLLAQLTSSASKKPGAQVGVTANVLQPLSISYPVNLTSGTLVGTGKSPSSISIPASYQGSGTPAPTYVNLQRSTARNARPATAAQVLLRGSPNQAFTLRITAWVLVISDSTIRSPSASRTGSIYYLGGARTNFVTLASGQLSSTGVATVGIGSTISMTLAKGATGQVTYRPQVAVNYN